MPNTETTAEITERILANVGLSQAPAARLLLSDRTVTETGLMNDDSTIEYVMMMEVPCRYQSGADDEIDMLEWVEVLPADWAALCDAEDAGR
tara:strand:- start:533 stop:808 length:276 start_codon:yes stop_codon:yes gene_type:complete